MAILLDTNALLWHVAGYLKLSTTAKIKCGLTIRHKTCL